MTITPPNNNLARFNPGVVQRSLAKAGGCIPTRVQSFCDLNSSGSMNRLTFFAIATTLILGARYFQARNEDEKREVLTRDSVAVGTAIYAVPFFKKFAGMLINKKTGIPVSYGEKGFRKNINPEGGVQLASYEQLAEWLSVKNRQSFDGIKNGFAGFCRNIKQLGGDVTRCFSVLDKNSGNSIKELADLLGYKKEITNRNIIGLINKAEKSTDKAVQQRLDSLKELFTGENKLLKNASNLKSVTGASCIAATALLLGVFLPWFNIQNTKKLYKNKNSQTNESNNSTPKAIELSNLNLFKKYEELKKTGKAD